MAKTIGLSLLLLLLFDYNQALIVPQELPSILSLVYSNIPQIKKGKDSRYGVGFRLGEHADFQFLFEFGPQTETKKIGSSDANKREVDQNDFPQLAKKRNTTNPEASSWLTNWSNNMTLAQRKRKKALRNSKKSTTTSTTSTTTMRTVTMISEDALKQLSQLYKLNTSVATEKNIEVTQSIEVTTKTPQEQKKIAEDLMDVKV